MAADLSNTQLGRLLDVLPDAVLMVDGRGHIVYVNHAVRMLLGHAPGDLLGQRLDVLLPAPVRARHAALVATYQREGSPMQMGARPVLHAVHRDGREVPVSISLANWVQDDGSRLSVAVMHDVSTLHTHLDRATELAETDALTGLGNRLRLSNWMVDPVAGGQPFALLYMDLRRFKQLNDTHGHAAGDRALQIVARRLLSQVRAAERGDLVVRLGGDEFVLALDGLGDATQLAQRARSVAEAVRQPLQLDDEAWTLGANIGGALFPRHGRNETELLHAADAAMYRAKQAGVDYALADDGRPPPGGA